MKKKKNEKDIVYTKTTRNVRDEINGDNVLIIIAGYDLFGERMKLIKGRRPRGEVHFNKGSVPLDLFTIKLRNGHLGGIHHKTFPKFLDVGEKLASES